MRQAIIVALEYVVALGAVANIVQTLYQFQIRTYCVFSPRVIWHPMIWAFLAAGIHIFGTLALYLRIKINSNDATHSNLPSRWARFQGRVRRFLRTEFTPSANHTSDSLEYVPEGCFFLIAPWLVSVLTAMHTFYGTIVFAGALFIGPQDAFIVVTRLGVSIAISRILLMYEVSGLNAVYSRAPN